MDHVPEIVLADVVDLWLRLGGESVLFIEGVVVSEALRRLKKSWFLNVVGFGGKSVYFCFTYDENFWLSL